MICILTIAVGFIAVHFFKMLRLYLVLMEHRISFGRFILLYLRTTFINLIIPFKLGELYRVEEIARVTKIWQVGFLSVLVDRFFDTLALLCVLLPLDLILRGGHFRDHDRISGCPFCDHACISGNSGELYLLKPVSDHAENIRPGTYGTARSGYRKVLV